jgi:large subunit ribosomal protein L31
MKSDIHPKYTTSTITTCICGAEFNFGSTLKDVKIEICASCHPFYTGQEKSLDTTGRVDKFKKRMAKATA